MQLHEIDALLVDAARAGFVHDESAPVLYAEKMRMGNEMERVLRHMVLDGEISSWGVDVPPIASTDRIEMHITYAVRWIVPQGKHALAVGAVYFSPWRKMRGDA